MRRRCVFAFLSLFCGWSFATAQIPDEILVDGERQLLFSEPFSGFLAESGQAAKLAAFQGKGSCTASLRGYAALWAIKNEALVLSKLVANPCNDRPTEVPISAFFPGTAGPVQAKWFSGTLVVPQGKMVAMSTLAMRLSMSATSC